MATQGTCNATTQLTCLDRQRIVPTRNPSSLRASTKTLAFLANFRIDDTEVAKFGRHFEGRCVDKRMDKSVEQCPWRKPSGSLAASGSCWC